MAINMLKKSPKVEVIEKGIYIKIYINGLLHFQVEKKSIISIQSWIMGDEGTWKIEYCTSGNSTQCEYVSEWLWRTILIGIDKLFSF
jgi:hypothetical protein